MDDERASLAGEAEAIRLQLNTAAIGSNAARRVAAARARFLPYVVVGGIPFAMLPALIAVQATAADTKIRGPMVAALAAGIVAGMTVGWISLKLLERLVWRRSPGRVLLDAAIVAATIPGYVVGGWTAALAALVVASLEDEAASAVSIPNIWPIFVVSAAVIYPISYIFARRDLDRPTRLADAISAAIHEPNQPSGTGYPILGRAVLTVILAFGTLVAVFLLIAALQSVAPERYADITSRVPMVFVVAFLLAWIGLTVGLWGLTMRFIRWLS